MPTRRTTALAMLEFDARGRATGHRMADPGEPQLAVTELAATRGDGVFETIGVFAGRPQAVDAHLARLELSARMLDLEAPPASVWRAAIADVADALGGADGVPDEASVKLVLSRGVEGADVPTAWAYAAPAPGYAQERRDGVHVVLLDRGLSHDVERTAPWLLAGAKTLSYAVNRAAVREAMRRGADDAVFVSSDGYLLEGTTSSLVLRIGGRVVTPRTDIGILAGTTQADVFRWAEDAGHPTGYELLRPDDLQAADAAWLVSSLRLAVPIRAVDGSERAVDPDATAAINAHLRARTD